MRPKKRLALACAALVSLAIFPGWECGQPVVEDPSFDLWCGTTLCAWDVDAGSVRRVSTWHRSDYGVELVGDPVRISQFSDISSFDSTCLLFELQADRDASARLQLELDFFDDGVIDYSHDLVANDWKQASYQVATPSWYSGVRFIVRKQGPGRAVLAHVRATRSSGCAGPPIELRDLRDGAQCAAAAQCADRFCEEIAHVSEWRFLQPSGSCSGCSADTDCSVDAVCGIELDPQRGLYKDCGAPARHVLGERCAGDAECATGVCCDDVCSECCDDHGPACAGAASCTVRGWWTLGQSYQGHLLPRQCSPGAGLGAVGAPCLADDDCQGGRCAGSGELKTCGLDGRRCTADSDCVAGHSCLALGVPGGRCQ